MACALKVCWCLNLIQMSFLAGTAYSQAPEHVSQHDETRGAVLASLPSPAKSKMPAMVATPYQQTGDLPLRQQHQAQLKSCVNSTALHTACQKHCCCVLLVGTLTSAIDKSSVGRSSGCP